MVKFSNAILEKLTNFICGIDRRDFFINRTHRDLDNFFTSLNITAKNNAQLSKPKFVFEVLRQLNNNPSSSKNLPYKPIARIIEYLCSYDHTQDKERQKSQMVMVNSLLLSNSLELGYIDEKQNITLCHISDEGRVNDGYSAKVKPKFFKRVGSDLGSISEYDAPSKEVQKIIQEDLKKTDSIIGNLENLLISAIYNQIITNPTLYESNSRNISVSRKKIVKRRDNFICQICLEKFEEEDLEVDHIYPYGLGGSHMAFNLMAICKNDNGEKGKKLQYYRSPEGQVKLRENIRIFVSTLEIIANFGHWLELINDKRRKTA